MAVNDAYVVSGAGIADSDDLIIAGSDTETGAAEVGELAGTVAAELYREVDVDDDGTYEVSAQIDSFNGSWHTQKNGLLVSDADNLRLRIVNVSGGAGGFLAAGMEVNG